MTQVRFTARAREDLLDIWLFVAARNSETVADRVYDGIKQTCELLREHPQIGRARPEIHGDARSLASTDGSPFTASLKTARRSYVSLTAHAILPQSNGRQSEHRRHPPAPPASARLTSHGSAGVREDAQRSAEGVGDRRA